MSTLVDCHAGYTNEGEQLDLTVNYGRYNSAQTDIWMAGKGNIRDRQTYGVPHATEGEDLKSHVSLAFHLLRKL